MGRELDAHVATTLGLEVVGEAWAWESWDGPGWFVGDREWEGRSLQPVFVRRCTCHLYPSDTPEWDGDLVFDHYRHCLEVVGNYSTDTAAARTMEDWIQEHGLQPRYAMAMMSVLLEDGCIPDHDELLWWALLHATPEQRRRAFLRAMGK